MAPVDLKEFDLDGLKDAVTNLEDAKAELPEVEQKAYRDAQQSVVEARRKAETHEGLLQVS